MSEEYIIESPQPSYEPGISFVNRAISRAVAITDIFGEHRIDYAEQQNGRVTVGITPLRGIPLHSLSFDDERAFGRTPILHWVGYKWGDERE